MKHHNIFFILLIAVFAVIACKKEPELSLERVKYNNNKTTYPETKMDSAQAINAITKQKVQEVIDLSILYSSGNQDTEIDTAMYSQILGYFHKADSTTLKPLLSELDSLKVKNARVSNLEVFEKIHKRIRLILRNSMWNILMQTKKQSQPNSVKPNIFWCLHQRNLKRNLNSIS
ncbi:hypothetical protein [Chryseobacterium taklimakanense]|uniref:hypothetical protein n=1 Tax=Chryseobacterium taklimakanense TaxID=536441 RepID=UPI001E2B7BB0|nr:hypothetical protein [Chryseobacterium taklimakanense]